MKKALTYITAILIAIFIITGIEFAIFMTIVIGYVVYQSPILLLYAVVIACIYFIFKDIAR